MGLSKVQRQVEEEEEAQVWVGVWGHRFRLMAQCSRMAPRKESLDSGVTHWAPHPTSASHRCKTSRSCDGDFTPARASVSPLAMSGS